MVETKERLFKPDEAILKDWLQNRLNDERYQHSLGAQAKAIELARRFHLSPDEMERAAVAALLHDAAKLMTIQELLEACERWNIPTTEEDRQLPQILHSLVGAELVHREFDITDEAVLNAIRYHTTGRSGMSRVEQIVYIADKIEENTRNPLYIQKINALVNFQEPEALEKVLLYILDSTITFLVEKGQIIHPRTIEARNSLTTRLHPSPADKSPHLKQRDKKGGTD